MSLNFFDPYAALASLEKKQIQSTTHAISATFATSKENQDVTSKKATRHTRDITRHFENTASVYGKCRTISHNVANGDDTVNIKEYNEIAQNVADVANVAGAKSEKPLFVDENANALRCLKCRYARTRYIPEEQREKYQGQSVWHGLCTLDTAGTLTLEGSHSRCGMHPFGDDDSIVVQ